MQSPQLSSGGGGSAIHFTLCASIQRFTAAKV
jgi:hypothetical protein